MRVSRMMQFPPFAACLALLGLLIVAGNAAAQAPECTMRVSEPVVDYGKLYGGDATRTLPARSVQLTVVCPTPMDLTVFYRGVTASQPERFQLADKGAFALRVRDATVDGQPVDLGDVPSTGARPSQIGPVQPLLPGRGLAPYRDGQSVHGMTLSATVDVDTRVDQRAGRRVSKDVPIEAHGFFESPAAPAKAAFGIVAAAAPGPCTIRFPNGGGNIDVGDIPLASLSPTATTTLSRRDVDVRIDCSAPAAVAMLVIDNRRGTALGGAIPEYSFGLGTTAAGKPIGYYIVTADVPTLDASPTNIIQSTQLSGPYAAIGGRPWAVPHTGANYLAFGPTTGPPAIVSIWATATLSFSITLAPRNNLEVRGPETIDGSMTLELVYP